MAREIKTTLAGSYPTAEWLRQHRTEEGLREATAEDMARALERAEAAVGKGRVGYIHPGVCPFSRARPFRGVRGRGAWRDGYTLVTASGNPSRVSGDFLRWPWHPGGLSRKCGHARSRIAGGRC